MNGTILSWLESSARQYPEKTAFADPQKSITYSDLVQRARAGATCISKKTGPSRPVLICCEKNTDAVSALFSVIYAGCFYSFTESNQPAARLEKLLQTLRPALIIADDEGRRCFESQKEIPEIIDIAELFSGSANVALLDTIRQNMCDTDPLYVNFTSGSTGMPKGVTISHRSVVDFIPVFTDVMGIESDDVFANQAPLDFDVSVKDIFSGIYKSATVNLIPREYFSRPTMLMDYLCDRGASVLIWAVSAMCFVSVMNGFEYRLPENIRIVGFSGEIMPVKHLCKWQKHLPHCKFVNLYGPTEITCNCTYHVIDRQYAKGDVIPIGRPFRNERVFLLDESDKLVSEPGKEGEICVCGTCLGLGYYNNKEKTDAAFVQNPLNSAYNELMYRTGDIGKYDDNGELIYVSRKDFQIKHQGHRIELGEIESAALCSEKVLSACCIYDADKSRIILFFAGSADKDELNGTLRELLPPFMLPNICIGIETMPMTKNGKTDRNALMQIYKDRK